MPRLQVPINILNVGGCLLNAVKFYFDTSVLSDNEETYIRPFIFDSSKTDLLITQNIVSLTSTSRDILIQYLKNPIKFEKKQDYYIGFEVIDKDNSKKKLKVRVLNSNRNYAILRSKPTDNWFKQDNNGNGLSLDYELYFEKP